MEANPNLSFGISNSRAMFGKLERELRRVRDSRYDREELVDAGVNFAITAWHLVEWTWAEIKGQYEFIAKLAQEAGTPAREFGRDRFREYVLERCPGLELCGAIANASKHVGAEKAPKDVEETFVSAASTSTLGAITLGDAQLGVECVLKIVSLGIRIPAEPIFETVVAWWKTFFERQQGEANQAIEPAR